MKKSIVHLTSAHPRFDIRIYQKECLSLSEKYNVSLIVADGQGSKNVSGINILDVGKPKSRQDRFVNTLKKV